MSAQSHATPSSGVSTHSLGLAGAEDIDLDAVDRAIDHGDLDTVRRLLGLSQTVWRLLLASL